MKAELATREDLPEILSLMKHCMPHLVRTKEELVWQYYGAPDGNPKFYIIRDAGQMTGLYSSYAQRIRINGKIHRARRTLDGMTHSNYGGRGYHGFLMNTCRANAVADGEVAYGFPNDKAIGAYQKYSKFMEFKKIWMRTCAIEDVMPVRDKTVLPVDGLFTEEDSGVWDSTRFKVAIHRDHRYLNWRYARPAQTYHRFRIGDNQGVLVLKVFSNDTDSFVHICELFVASQAEDQLSGVLSFCREFGQKHGARTLTAWLPRGHFYENAFEASGIGLKETTRFMFISAPEDVRDIVCRDGAWHLTQGDSDVY